MSTSPVAEARSLEDDGCALSHVGPSGTHPPDLGREAASGWRPTKPRLKSGRAGPSRIQRPRPSITGACVKPLACRKRRRALCARGSARLTVVSVVRQARSQRVPACSRARERVRRMKRGRRAEGSRALGVQRAAPTRRGGAKTRKKRSRLKVKAKPEYSP